MKDHWFVRPATMADLGAILDLARQTGAGFSNLPADEAALRQRLERCQASMARDVAAPDDELYIFVLEHQASGRIGGTAMIFSQVGVRRPFYSYKVTRLTQYSRALDRLVTTNVLFLVNDLAGASEVAGLFLLPDLRRSGLGQLLARSRYLFMTLHRERFATQVLTELRGYQEPEGVSPFWEGLTRRFFNLEFEEADRFNALNGNQFIADLMPKYPIYTNLLPDEAQHAIGRPHKSGVAAMRLLEAEGFRFDGYVDLFDAGPTMRCLIDDISTVRAARNCKIALSGGAEPQRYLLASGRLTEFRAALVEGNFDDKSAVLHLAEDGYGKGLFTEGQAAIHVEAR